MNTFQLRPKRERAEVIEETAARLRIGRPAIVEKDYWVCWALSKLFGKNAPLRQEVSLHPFLFKGGTSLSKVYGLIDRFSEDIDLTIDRSLLENPEAPADEAGISKNERKRRLDDLAARCSVLIRNEVAPYLRACVTDLEGARVEIDQDDPQTVKLIYPYVLPSNSYGGGSYVNTEIRLEFGARGALWPASEGIVTAYVAAEFPELFDEPHVNVWTMDVQRTFWEKATILHAVACSERLGNSERQSRHYADLARLAVSVAGQQAVLNTQLLIDVAEHKAVYFAAPSAKYALARPGTLRLSPPDRLVETLRADYSSMREMFISDPPSFDTVMQEIAALELRINQRRD